MGQNQARAGEQQGTVKEQEPGPDPGGSEKEGNASEVTCGEVEDEAGSVRERLDGSPGTEPASPTLKLDTHAYKKGAPPMDWEWIQGGDGEREGGIERREGEGGRIKVCRRDLQELNNIRVTKRGLLSRETAGCSKPERIAVAKRSNRMDDIIQDLAWDSSSTVENVYFQRSESSVATEKSVTSEVVGSLRKQDGSGMTDTVAVPGINTLAVTEDFHDDNFPINLRSEAPTRVEEKNNLDTLNVRLPEGNPLCQDGPSAIPKSHEPSSTEEERARLSIPTSSRDDLTSRWKSTNPECQKKIISSDQGSSGVQEHPATSEQIYGTEIPTCAVTFDLLERSELKATENICPLNSGEVCDFRDKFGKMQAAGSDVESGDATEKYMANPNSSEIESLDLATYKGSTTSGFEELLEEEKHFSMPHVERLRNNAERRTDISCDADGAFKESKAFPPEPEDEVDYYPSTQTANIQTEKIPEQCLAMVTGQLETLSHPDMTKSITGKMDPHLALYAAMESKDALVRVKEMSNQEMFLFKATASQSDLDNLPGNFMSSNQDRDKGRTMATVENVKERSAAMVDEDRGESFGEMTSSKMDRDKEAAASISNSKLVSASEGTAGHEEGSPLLSKVESKTSVALAEFLKSMESHEAKNVSNETQLCTRDPLKAFTGPVWDACGGSVSHNTGTDPPDVQNSPQVCCMLRDTDHNNLTPQSTGQPVASEYGATQLRQIDQSIRIRNDQTPVSAQSGVPATEKAESPPKGKPVSDLIKETIQRHEKMKEWTKPAEAKADVVLDSAQCVKVAQMKAAFDSPKKSLDKGLEKKPSVRKGRTRLPHAI